VSVWKSRHTFDPAKGKFTTWLYRITVNQCARTHRKKQPNLQSLEKAMDNGLHLRETSSTRLPNQSALMNSEGEQVMGALNLLNSRHHSVMVLRDYSDLSYDEIADVLNIPSGTVKSRINHALKSMRKQVSVR